MRDAQFSCRGNSRTPMQWDNSNFAGFSSSKPWLDINQNYKNINAAAQENDANSCLNYFRKMVQLRKSTPAFVYGAYEILDRQNPNIYAYTRTMNGKSFLVLLNFKITIATFNSKLDLRKATLKLNNYGTAKKMLNNYALMKLQFMNCRIII